MSKKPQILDTRILAQSPLFTIEGLQLKFSNGEQRQYERIKASARGAVMVIPMLDDETLLLIREYGAGVDDYVLTFPKGAIDLGEDALTTANRELMEEAGYGSDQLTHLGKLSASPGYLSAKMDIILAEKLYEKRLPGDEPEPIEVLPWPLAKIDQLLSNPEFHEARSLAALYLLERHKNNGA